MSQFINYHYILSSHFIPASPPNKCLVISHLKIIKLFVLEGERKHTWEILSIQNLTLPWGQYNNEESSLIETLAATDEVLFWPLRLTLHCIVSSINWIFEQLSDWLTEWLRAIFHQQIFSLTEREREQFLGPSRLPNYCQFSCFRKTWRLQGGRGGSTQSEQLWSFRSTRLGLVFSAEENWHLLVNLSRKHLKIIRNWPTCKYERFCRERENYKISEDWCLV